MHIWLLINCTIAPLAQLFRNCQALTHSSLSVHRYSATAALTSRGSHQRVCAYLWDSTAALSPPVCTRSCWRKSSPSGSCSAARPRSAGCRCDTAASHACKLQERARACLRPRRVTRVSPSLQKLLQCSRVLKLLGDCISVSCQGSNMNISKIEFKASDKVCKVEQSLCATNAMRLTRSARTFYTDEAKPTSDATISRDTLRCSMIVQYI